jgi:hypothetical protein
MAALDLRPLSLGELLDRTFFLYRRNFLLFVGIAAIPYLGLTAGVLGFALLAKFAGTYSPVPSNHLPLGAPAIGAIGGGVFLVMLVFLSLFLLSAGAAVFAVAEIYAGRQARIRVVVRLALGRLWTILGVTLLSFLFLIVGLIFLIVPGIYIACRISVGTAAALIDEMGPMDAIRRSFGLTKGFAGRAFVIVLLTVALSWALVAVFQIPFMVLAAASAKNPQMVLLWTILMEIGNVCGSVLVAPISTIAFALYYYDLRVRKEAFDLQMMMQAIGADPMPPPVTGGVPSMFGRDAS